MNSIGDVLAQTPGPSWHECVAIVQEIAAHLEQGQPLPAPEDLLLEPDGTITFGFAGESNRPQVADLASLLDSLLKKTEAPQGLRQLAAESAGANPAHSNIATFTRALAFYERPNRPSDLQALAGRLEGRADVLQADKTLAEIRERVVRKSEEEQERKEQKTPKPQKQAPEPQKQQAEPQRQLAEPKKPADVQKPAEPPVPKVKPIVNRALAVAKARALAIAAALVFAVAAVSAMTVLRGWTRAAAAEGNPIARAAVVPPAPPAADAGSTATDAASRHAVSTDRGRSSTHRPIGTSAAALKTKPSKPVPGPALASVFPSDRLVARNSSSRVIDGGVSKSVAPVNPLPALPTPVVPAAGPAASRPAAPAHVTRATDTLISTETPYTSADPDVTPPVWLRRQLPSEPSPDSRTGFFEIVIDTNGDVENVRLISPTKRYEERMLTAAAKAWKFRPARLNGQPVKYRMRVPITLTWTIDQ